MTMFAGGNVVSYALLAVVAGLVYLNIVKRHPNVSAFKFTLLLLTRILVGPHSDCRSTLSL